MAGKGITTNSQSREAASSLGRRRNGRPDRRSHFSGSTKIPGNEPVLQSGKDWPIFWSPRLHDAIRQWRL